MGCWESRGVAMEEKGEYELFEDFSWKNLCCGVSDYFDRYRSW